MRLSTPRGIPKLNTNRFRLLQAWALVGTFALAGLWSTPSHAVNYMDPNLSDRNDAISRAALACNSFHGMEEFKHCLSENGVTDITEQKDALNQARFTAFDTSMAPPPARSKELAPADSTVDSSRAPASSSAKQAR